MGFFYNETKKSPAPAKTAGRGGRKADIPIASLRQMGCAVCPKDKADLHHPKMAPDGPKTAPVYLLMAAPTEDDDKSGVPLSGKLGDHVWSKFGKGFMERDVRVGYVTQCHGDQTVVEVECCRGRVTADIEATKPLIVVGIGDAPLQWAVAPDIGSSIPHRGTLFTVKIGNHVCYYLPILFPNYLHKKKQYGKSEYELAFEHDVAKLKELLDSNLLPPQFYSGNYDEGIELITGQEPGDFQRLEAALSGLAGESKSSIDLETNGLRPYFLKDPHIWTASVGTFERTVAFPLDHPEGWGSESRRRKVWELFGEYLLNSGRKTAHNLSMEMEWLGYFYGGKLLRQTEWDDTMALAHTLDERPGTKSLDIQTRIHFGFSVKDQSRVDPKRLLEYPIKEALRYNGLDTKWTDLLRRKIEPVVRAEPAYEAEYERKIRLAPTLVLTEARGLDIDLKYANDMLTKLSSEAKAIEAKLKRCPEIKEFDARFGSFQPTNADQVLKLMRDICQREEVRVEDPRTQAVRWTSDEEALSKIPVKEVPSAPLILEHRAISKLVGTYVKPIIDGKIICPDGKVRSKYGSMVAVTGRLNSEDPNIQNWPKRKHKEIRGMAYAPDGEWLLACDYGQIEFRVVGMASEDPNLVKYCWTGYDVHKYWAERMVAEYGPIKDYIVETFGVDWDEKGLKTLRQEAKNGWVFPQLFGSSTRSCAEQLHLPDNIAEDLAAEFWDEFREVKKWQEKLLKSYERNLYVETLGGRRRRGPMTKNEIINLPIQGTASDIVTEGMNVISEMGAELDDESLIPVLNVHDDLTFRVKDAELEDKIEIISREMCRPRFNYINVPLVVEVSVGNRWSTLEEIKVVRSHEIFNTRNPYV